MVSKSNGLVVAVVITAVALPPLQASAQHGREALICAARMTALAAVMEIGGDISLRDRILSEAERSFERARATTPDKDEANLRRELRTLIAAAAPRYRDKGNVSKDLRRCANH